ncbi:MAG: ATP-binding protein [Actinomycetota bacterium]
MEKHQEEPRRVDSDERLERYRRLVEDSGVGLFQTGVDGSIRWVNTAAARIVGYETSEDFVSNVSNISEIYVDPSRRAEFRREIETHGFASGFEYEIRRKDAAIRWIAVSARPWHGADGAIEGFEGTVTDVTNRKLLAAALDAVSSRLGPTEAVSRFGEVLERVVPYRQVTLALIEEDHRHYRRIASISPSGTASSFPDDESVPLAGNSMEMALSSQRPVVVNDTSEEVWEFDRVLRERGVVSYAIFPLVDDTGVFATFNIGAADTGVFSDDVLSLLESISAAVRNAVKNLLLLEREREAHRRMEEMNRLKNDFLARVSHDLRSPLTVIDGVAHMTQKQWDRLSEEDRQRRFDVILRQGHRMSELLRRDLDVALIESGELACLKEPFDLGAVVRGAVEDLRASSASHRLDLVVQEPLPTALGDRERNLQILGNLLSNATKFSPAGTVVRVRVRREMDEVRVDVQDEGVGIEPNRRDELFERMSRLAAMAEGTGLGLYICKSLVEAQGGRIWVSGDAGQGACFSYTMPVAAT